MESTGPIAEALVKSVKVLIVGAWRWSQYEEAFAQGLKENDVKVAALCTRSFFQGTLGRHQLALPVPGPNLYKLNRAVVLESARERPDWVLFWRPTHILPRTINELRRMGIGTVSYNNDDPFGPDVHGDYPWHHKWLWYWYKRCLPSLDKNFFYRPINCTEALESGAQHADVLMPYFIPWRDRPVTLTDAERERFETDVVFVGHYEPDGRAESLGALVDAGIRTKIWGGGYWRRSSLGTLYPELGTMERAEGDDYAKALCGAKVCLCFLSKLNRDCYTRRYFEIAACGRPILGERTRELQRLFEEDEEACFFSSDEELVTKARWLLENPVMRERIAQAGQRRIWMDSHDVTSRAGNFVCLVSGYCSPD